MDISLFPFLPLSLSPPPLSQSLSLSEEEEEEILANDLNADNKSVYTETCQVCQR